MLHYCQKAISFASLAIFLLFGKPAFSQEPDCLVRKVPVSFRDAQNLPIQNLSVGDLEAKSHGKPVEILSLAPDSRPHRTVLILDTSASIGRSAGEPAVWNLELSLARNFFDLNRQKSQIALLFFNNQVTDTVNFSQGNGAVGDKLEQVRQDRSYMTEHIKGKTALWDAILQGVQLLDHPSSADALYVLTDGEDNASKASLKELEKRLATTSVRLFAVLLFKETPYRNKTSEELAGPEELAGIAKSAGGEILTMAEWHNGGVALSASPEAKMKSAETLSRLYQAILGNNLLEIKLPFPNLKSQHWELKLSEEARRKLKGAHITYPDPLLGCGSEVESPGRH